MEFVYVVKRTELFDLSFPHGLVVGADDGRVAVWRERMQSRGFFVERPWAEQDSSLKQIIPYTVVTHGQKVFRMRRLNQGGEARLHDKLSIGVGGHINPVDGTARTDDVVAAACRREIDEEIVIPGGYGLRTVGALNDESNDVGSVHFGVVNVALSETAEVTVRETDMLEGEFVSVDELLATEAERPGSFESWSALLLPHLATMLA